MRCKEVQGQLEQERGKVAGLEAALRARGCGQGACAKAVLVEMLRRELREMRRTILDGRRVGDR